MKKSGITRRIDGLGRIVIPKEIRKNLKIMDSDEMEINIIDNKIVLNKYDSLKKDKVISNMLKCIGKMLKKNVLFTSKDKIIDYYIINNENVKDLELSNNIIKIIQNRNTIKSKLNNFSFLNSNDFPFYMISPLIINGDLIGSIILCSSSDINDSDEIIMRFSKIFLENYLE